MFILNILLIGLLILSSVSANQIEQSRVEVEEQVQTEVVYADPKCKTPNMPREDVIRIINETKTKDLNFVALAEAESHLNNTSIGAGKYYGIFQIYPKYHILNDYCDPAEQVKWLEKKLDDGADPKNLFPTLWNKLYE